jgi:hypothetical protein
MNATTQPRTQAGPRTEARTPARPAADGPPRDRWTIRVPNEFVDQSTTPLANHLKLALQIIEGFARRHCFAHPSIETLARKYGCKKRRMFGILDELEGLGRILRIPAVEGRRDGMIILLLQRLDPDFPVFDPDGDVSIDDIREVVRRIKTGQSSLPFPPPPEPNKVQSVAPCWCTGLHSQGATDCTQKNEELKGEEKTTTNQQTSSSFLDPPSDEEPEIPPEPEPCPESQSQPEPDTYPLADDVPDLEPAAAGPSMHVKAAEPVRLEVELPELPELPEAGVDQAMLAVLTASVGVRAVATRPKSRPIVKASLDALEAEGSATIAVAEPAVDQALLTALIARFVEAFEKTADQARAAVLGCYRDSLAKAKEHGFRFELAWLDSALDDTAKAGAKIKKTAWVYFLGILDKYANQGGPDTSPSRASATSPHEARQTLDWLRSLGCDIVPDEKSPTRVSTKPDYRSEEWQRLPQTLKRKLEEHKAAIRKEVLRAPPPVENARL